MVGVCVTSWRSKGYVISYNVTLNWHWKCWRVGWGGGEGMGRGEPNKALCVWERERMMALVKWWVIVILVLFHCIWTCLSERGGGGGGGWGGRFWNSNTWLGLGWEEGFARITNRYWLTIITTKDKTREELTWTQLTSLQRIGQSKPVFEKPKQHLSTDWGRNESSHLEFWGSSVVLTNRCLYCLSFEPHSFIDVEDSVATLSWLAHDTCTHSHSQTHTHTHTHDKQTNETQHWITWENRLYPFVSMNYCDKGWLCLKRKQRDMSLLTMKTKTHWSRHGLIGLIRSLDTGVEKKTKVLNVGVNLRRVGFACD